MIQTALVAPLLAVLAWAYLEMSHLDGAVETIESALRRARREQIWEHLVDTLGVRARALIARQCWETPLDTINERLSLMSAMPYPYARATSLYDLGLLSTETGKLYVAREQLKQAVEVFHQLGAKKAIERTEQALGKLDRV